MVEEFGIGVVQQLYHGIAASNPMNLGVVAPGPIKAADCIVAFDCVVPWYPKTFGPGKSAKLAHVAADPHHAHIPMRGFQTDLLVAGDTGATIFALREVLRTKLKGAMTKVDARRKRMIEARAKVNEDRAAMIKEASDHTPINPVFIAHALNQVKSKNAIFSEELGVPLPLLELENPKSYLTTTSGALGMGLGQALGREACRARPSGHHLHRRRLLHVLVPDARAFRRPGREPADADPHHEQFEVVGRAEVGD